MGRIHPDAQSIHFANHPDHRQVVEPFLSCFDVTHGSTTVRGNTKGYRFFLSPEQFIAELVGIRRELLLLYSPYDDFQPRALRLLDETLEKFRDRLDPLGSIVVSDDPEVRQKLHEILAEQPERPPVVAVPKERLKTLSHHDDIRELLIEQLFERDLFGLESPLQRELSFFGRDRLVSELLDRFRAGQNSGLFGLRRIGKTSVLYAIMRRCRKDQLAGDGYLDVSNPAVYKQRWWSALQEIVRRIAEPLELRRGQRSKIRALTVEYEEENAAKHFTSDVNSLLSHFSSNRLFLALDEIESITFDVSPEPHWETDFLPFWRTLRSVHQNTEGAFSFVIAGVNPHALEEDQVGGHDNPLFSTVKEYFLPPFDYETVRQMVRRLARYMGLRPEEGLYGRLHEEYGGHPFLVRQACSYLSSRVEERPADLPVELFEQEQEHLALSLERNVRQILNVLEIWYPEEYSMLAELAQGNAKTFVEFAELSAEFTQHMEGYGLVDDPRGNPKITIGLVEEYLQRERARETFEKDVKSTEDVLAEISRRRNRIEPELRKLLMRGLRFRYGKKAGKKALACLPEHRREALANYSYQDMWDETYFNELASVLDQEWDCFQSWFGEDKVRVMRWMQHINDSRADAHAKELSSDEFDYLRVCFRNLERHLDIS